MKNDTLVELISLLVNKTDSNTELPLEIGEKYFVRMVTHYMVGELVEIKGGFLVFIDASWVADTGRFMDFLKEGEPKEVEPVKGVYRVAIGSVVDIFDWSHKLPSVQK